MNEYESRLLSKYLQPPNLPTSNNYSHMRNLARQADGRGPYMPTKNYTTTSSYGAASMQKRLK